MAKSERKSHSKNRQVGSNTKKTYRKLSEQLFPIAISSRWPQELMTRASSFLYTCSFQRGSAEREICNLIGWKITGESEIFELLMFIITVTNVFPAGDLLLVVKT